MPSFYTNAATISGLWRGLWLESSVIAVAAVYLWGISSGGLGPASTVVRQRLLAIFGLMATAALIFLGGIWPSIFTLVAIPVIPSLFFFAGTIVRPALASSRPKLRVYLTLCVIASALAWVCQISWELSK